jgi:hypothetical protein
MFKKFERILLVWHIDWILQWHAATVINDSDGNIIKVITKRLTTNDAAIGEAQVALLAIQTATSCGVNSLII